MLEDAPKMRSMCRYITVIVVLLFAPIAWAQEESWGDWAKQCEPAGGGAERCYIIQTVQADDRPVMVIVVAYSPQRDRIAAMIDVPLEMHLPSGLEVKAGDVSKTIAFEQCLPTGCRAMLPVDDEILEALKSGAAIAVGGKDGQSQDVQLPVSTNGFEEAFGAL